MFQSASNCKTMIADLKRARSAERPYGMVKFTMNKNIKLYSDSSSQVKIKKNDLFVKNIISENKITRIEQRKTRSMRNSQIEKNMGYYSHDNE